MNVYDFTVTTAAGAERSLKDYEGEVLLIVNTASKCGFTPQYQGLQELHQRFRQQGFSVLGFPCNQFGNQEPGTNEDIQAFCEKNYSVTFPVFAKLDVNGETAHPLYRHLKAHIPGVLGSEGIKWNFTKFLVNRRGDVVRRYAPQTSPGSIAGDIEKMLAEG